MEWTNFCWAKNISGECLAIVLLLLSLSQGVMCVIVYSCVINTGDSCWGWTESVTCSEGGCWSDQSVTVGTAAALPSDSDADLCREKLDDCLPSPHRDDQRFQQMSCPASHSVLWQTSLLLSCLIQHTGLSNIGSSGNVSLEVGQLYFHTWALCWWLLIGPLLRIAAPCWCWCLTLE